MVDAQGNVVPGQVVIYQVQSGPGQPAGQIGMQTKANGFFS